jgi:hypothetical protein
VCICFNCMQFDFFLRSIAQLDDGDVTIWYHSVLWSSMAQLGWPGML